MDFLFASILYIRIGIKNRHYIKFFFATGVLVIRSKRSIQTHFDNWWFSMYMTVSQLRNMKIVGTPFTLEYVQIRPYLPVDFSPGNSVCFSHKSNEFLQVPSSIHHMFCSNLSVIVNIRFSFVTVKNSPLIHCK